MNTPSLTSNTSKNATLGEHDGYALSGEFAKPLKFFGELIPHYRAGSEGSYTFPTFPGWKSPDTRIAIHSVEEMDDAWRNGTNGSSPIRAWAVVPREHGLIVLDIDQHVGNGFAELASLSQRSGIQVPSSWLSQAPEHPCFEVTPRGGIHLYFRWDGKPVKKGTLGKSIELLQDSTFVAGSWKYPDKEPTRLVGRYEDIPEMPGFLKELIEFSEKETPGSTSEQCPNSFSSGESPFHSEGDIFEEARSVFPSRIEEFFLVQGAHWKDDQYHTLNPLRPDRHIGSFLIKRDGRWFDFATNDGGDGIDLVARWKGMSPLDASKFILGTLKQHQNPAPETMMVAKSTEVSATSTKDRRIRLVPISKIKLEPPQWLIEDFVEVGTLSLIYGPPETLKTFVALSWALSISSGKHWNGCPTRQGSVVYVCSEGKRNFKRRVQAWCEYNGVPSDNLPFYCLSANLAMDNQGQVQELTDAISELVSPPQAIFVDTLNRSFGNGDENSTRDMTKFTNVCDSLKDKFGCAVILVHHSGHTSTDRARGSSALRGVLDHEYMTDRDKKAGTLRLHCTKSKDSAPPNESWFKLHEVQLGIDHESGKVLTGMVIVPTEAVERERSYKLGTNQILALSILKKLLAETMTGDEDTTTSSFVDLSVWSTRCREQGLEPKAFYKVKETMIEKGIVVVDTHGRVTLG